MSNLISVYVNGSWVYPNRPEEDNPTSDLVIYDVGQLLLMCSKEKFQELYNNDKFDDYDSFICLEEFNAPDWSGIIRFVQP